MSDYIVHKAVELEKVKKKLLPGVVAGLWKRMRQPKYDGCNAVIFPAVMRSRTNETVLSCQHLIDQYSRDGYVIFGEVWHPEWPQTEISGAFRRHTPEPELVFIPFDCVTQEEFDAGYSPMPYGQRLANLVDELRIHPVTNWFDDNDPDQDAVYYVKKGGYDGIMLKDIDAPWIRGSGTDGAVIKCKPTITLDLEVIGYQEGKKGKYAGTLGALVVRSKGGYPQPVSGMSDDERAAWWRMLTNPDRVTAEEIRIAATVEPMSIGTVIEVECLGIYPSGALREPRYKSIRYDKLTPDY